MLIMFYLAGAFEYNSSSTVIARKIDAKLSKLNKSKRLPNTFIELVRVPNFENKSGKNISHPYKKVKLTSRY